MKDQQVSFKRLVSTFRVDDLLLLSGSTLLALFISLFNSSLKVSILRVLTNVGYNK